MPRLSLKRQAKKLVSLSPYRDRIIESRETLDQFIQAFFRDPRQRLDEEGNPRGLRLAGYQLEFIHRVLSRDPGKYVFVASTRAGKSFSTAVAGLLMALLYDNEDVVIVAPSLEQSLVIYRYIRNMVKDNEVIHALVDWSEPFRLDRMTFRNGSTIRALSVAKNERVLGYGASTLIIDETASIDDEKLKTEVLRMLASPRNNMPPVLVLLGTPQRAGLLYEAWMNPEFYRIRVTWRDAVEAGIMDREYVEFVRSTLTEEEFRIWYEAEFVDVGSQLFPDTIVSQAIREDGNRRVPRHGREYVAGLDVALGGQDCTSLAILSYDPGRPAEEQVVDVEWIGELCKARGYRIVEWTRESLRRFGVRYLGVDAIGVGDTMVDFLRRELDGVSVYGVKLVRRERIDAYSLLRRALADRRITLPDIPRLRDQFRSFRIEHAKDGSTRIAKARGARDDMVDAITIAYYILSRRLSHRITVSWELDEYVRSIVGI